MDDRVDGAGERDPAEVIWPVGRIVEFAGHHHPDVRAWALRRLDVLDPDAAARAASSRLSDEDPEVLRSAIDVLTRRSAAGAAEGLRKLVGRASLPPGTRAAVLQALVRGGSVTGAEIERLAEGLHRRFREEAWRTRADANPAGCRHDLLALLASAGSGVADERIADWLEILTAVAEPDDVPVLVRGIAGLPSGEAEAPAEALLARCAASDLLPGEEGGVEDLLADLEQDCRDCGIPFEELCPKAVLRHLAKALRRGRWRETIEAASAAMAPRAEPGGFAEATGWSRVVMAALGAGEAPTDLDGRIAFALALGDGRRRLAAEALRADAVERLVRVRPLLHHVEWDAVDREILRRWAAGPDEVRQSIRRRVLEDLQPERPRSARFAAVRLAGRLDGFPAARTVLEALTDDWTADERVPASELLARRPSDLRALSPGFLVGRNDACSRVVLGALSLQPYRWASALIAEHLAALLDADLAEEVWNALEDLGDPATIDTAVREWRPDEGRVAALIRLLSMLGRAEATIPREIVREADEAREEWRRDRPKMMGMLGRLVEADARGDKEVRDEDLKAVLDRPLRLELRCNRCRRTYNYEVQQAFVHPDREHCEKDGWDGVVLSRIIVCKNCGAEDDYGLTTTGMAAVLGRLMLRAAKGKPALDSDERVQAAVTNLWDGTAMRRPSQGLAHLRTLAEAAPDRAEPWRRLGNLARRYDRIEEAEAVLRKAMDLDDKEVDAPHVLADMMWEQGRMAEALPAFLTAVERLGRSSLELAERAEVAGDAVRFIQEIARDQGAPPALLVVWAAGKSDGEPVVSMSHLELGRFRRWEELAGFFASGDVMGLEPTFERPSGSPSLLEARLAAAADRTVPPALFSTRSDGPADSNRRPGASRPPAPVARGPKPGRNDPCPCGSGKKYKRCCGR
jgi:hypothetical protein